MILVEIATRSDLISVSASAASPDDMFYCLFDLCAVTSRSPPQEQCEGLRMDVMWRPPLPELKSGKADTDCPSQALYSEVLWLQLHRHVCSGVMKKNIFTRGN